MQGYSVTFNIYAESQDEADRVSRLLADFVDGYARQGIAVSAGRLLSAPRVWETNAFVKSQITKFLTR